MHALIQNDLEIKENVKRLIQTVCKIRSKNENIIFSYRLWNVKSISENDVNSSILEALGNYYKIQNILERSQKEKFIELDKKIFLNQDIEFEWPSLDKEIISEVGKCYGLRKQIGILVNGDVVPCCLDQNGAICLGNIFESKLEEILNSEKAKKIENGFCKRILVEELCKRCGFINTRLN
jgi:radical SAM protein with 4Fe4S-binding SPASM domain